MICKKLPKYSLTLKLFFDSNGNCTFIEIDEAIDMITNERLPLALAYRTGRCARRFFKYNTAKESFLQKIKSGTFPEGGADLWIVFDPEFSIIEHQISDGASMDEEGFSRFLATNLEEIRSS